MASRKGKKEGGRKEELDRNQGKWSPSKDDHKNYCYKDEGGGTRGVCRRGVNFIRLCLQKPDERKKETE